MSLGSLPTEIGKLTSLTNDFEIVENVFCDNFPPEVAALSGAGYSGAFLFEQGNDFGTPCCLDSRQLVTQWSCSPSEAPTPSPTMTQAPTAPSPQPTLIPTKCGKTDGTNLGDVGLIVAAVAGGLCVLAASAYFFCRARRNEGRSALLTSSGDPESGEGGSAGASRRLRGAQRPRGSNAGGGRSHGGGSSDEQQQIRGSSRRESRGASGGRRSGLGRISKVRPKKEKAPMTSPLLDDEDIAYMAKADELGDKDDER